MNATLEHKGFDVVAAASVTEALEMHCYRSFDIGDDVTVRYFAPKPTPHGLPVGRYQIVQIGEEVTVRYFTP